MDIFNTTVKAILKIHFIQFQNYGNQRCSSRIGVFISMLALIINLSVSAQSPQSTFDSVLQKDKSLRQFSGSVKLIIEEAKKHSMTNYETHSLLLAQNEKFEILYNEVQNAKTFLKQGFEYKKVMNVISQVTSWKEIAVEGVITNKDSLQTIRNLTATSILLNELIRRVDTWLNIISKYQKSLGAYQNRLDSLANDGVLYRLPGDSVSVIAFLNKLNRLKSSLNPVVASLNSAIDSTERIQQQLIVLKGSLESDIAATELLRKQMDEITDYKELDSFSKSASRFRSFREIYNYSYTKAELLISFYIVNHLFLLLLMIVSLIGIAAYLRFLVRKCKKDAVFDILSERTLLLLHPFASAILISLTLFQFFLPLPPFIITSFLWLVCSLALTRIIWKSMSFFWLISWLVILLLFIFGLFDNFLLVQSSAERWVILLMGITGLIIGAYFVLSRKGKPSKDKMFFVLLFILSAYQFFSIYLNLIGNYNMAKAFMTNGYATFVVAFMVYWTIRLTRDAINITRFFNKHAEDDRAEIPLDKIGGKLTVYFYVIIVFAWFVLLSRYTHAYQSLFEPLGEALKENRSIGKFEYTYQSVLVFFFVLFLSGALSKVVSFLSSDVNTTLGYSREKGPGSWILLVRIAIISVGVVLAFVAAGIPMDRFAIIIGALSVGIGFGLQTLINNLVSGLIIAFEKPINVGDIVEIQGSIGKMKSIGIRSSVISTWDGSDVIIPNGDLLSQHLVNWTMGNTKRRFEIPVSVAYGTNLKETQQLLLELMLREERILRIPSPFVWITTFNNSSIDFVLKFWVGNFAIGFDVKSDLMLAVDALFKEKGIVIPFPQRDIHIISDDSTPEVNGLPEEPDKT